eukprot:3281042-Amphidinium_carterae.1
MSVSACFQGMWVLSNNEELLEKVNKAQVLEETLAGVQASIEDACVLPCLFISMMSLQYVGMATEYDGDNDVAVDEVVVVVVVVLLLMMLMMMMRMMLMMMMMRMMMMMMMIVYAMQGCEARHAAHIAQGHLRDCLMMVHTQFVGILLLEVTELSDSHERSSLLHEPSRASAPQLASLTSSCSAMESRCHMLETSFSTLSSKVDAEASMRRDLSQKASRAQDAPQIMVQIQGSAL